MSPEEGMHVAAIERYLGRTVPRVLLPDFDYRMKPTEIKQVVGYSDRERPLPAKPPHKPVAKPAPKPPAKPVAKSPARPAKASRPGTRPRTRPAPKRKETAKRR
jgi:hypothetical protein